MGKQIFYIYIKAAILYTLYLYQNNIVVSMPKIIARKYENPFWINITVLLDTQFYDQVRSDCSKYTTCTCLYCSFKYGSCFILLYVFLFFIELVNTSEFSNVSYLACSIFFS